MVIVGSKASGTDIARDIATVAKKVYVCHRSNDPPSSREDSNIEQCRGLKVCSYSSTAFWLRTVLCIAAVCFYIILLCY